MASEINTEGTGIVVTWQAPASCEPDTYAIYRKIVGAGPGTTRIAEVDGSTFEYTDENVVAGTTYRYRIRSNDIGPKSAKTAPTMAEPPAPVRAPAPPPPPPPPEEPPAPPPPPTIEYVPEPEPEIAEQHEAWSCGNSDTPWVHQDGDTVCQEGHDNRLRDNVGFKEEDENWNSVQLAFWNENKTKNCAKNAYWTGEHCAFYLQTFNYDTRNSRVFPVDVNDNEHYVDFSHIASVTDLCYRDEEWDELVDDPPDCTVRYCFYMRDTGSTKAPVCSAGSTYRLASWVVTKAEADNFDPLKHVSWL